MIGQDMIQNRKHTLHTQNCNIFIKLFFKFMLIIWESLSLLFFVDLKHSFNFMGHWPKGSKRLM